MADSEDRIRRLEERLSAIEERLGISKPVEPPTQAAPLPPPPTPLPTPSRPSPAPVAATPPRVRRPEATTILGWSGVAALVLAAAYLVRLAIDYGWLTPIRQVALALLGGVALIGLGVAFRHHERRYLALLPAGGIVILFITAYGAHHYHHLAGPWPTAVAVTVICLLALGLREIIDNELYTIFPVAGSYTIPVLLPGLRPWGPDLYIHFVAWGILFSWYAIRTKRRRIYLLAAYLAFIVFDFVWRSRNLPWWEQEAIFLFVQFLIFTTATIVFSIRHRAPLGTNGAIAHLPVLLIFYFLEYSVLYRHIPDWAPWIAFASVGLVWTAYSIARGRIGEELAAGRNVVTVYAAVVLLHAGYLDLLPDEWRGWATLAAVVIAGVVMWKMPSLARTLWPFAILILVCVAHNELRVLIGEELKTVPLWQLMLVLYAALPYVGYALRTREPALWGGQAGLLLALGHANTMTAAIHLFDSRLVVSLVWGILAVTSLVIAIVVSDRTLGRSALVIYAASGMKVLLFDLSGAAPLVRIGCLVVLGITLYAGGLLYKRIQAGAPSPA